MPSMGRFLLRGWPVDWLQLVFLGACMLGQVLLLGRMQYGWLCLTGDLAGLLLLLLIIRFSNPEKPRRGALQRLAHGAFVVPLVFTQVGLSIMALHLPDHAPLLERMDSLIFLGKNPLESVETIAFPLLTEVMQWAYTSYIFLLPGMALLLALKGSPRLIARSLFSLLGIIYLSYVGYFLISAAGPNIHNNLWVVPPAGITVVPLYHFKGSLPGIWLTDFLRNAIFRAELSKMDCFPSGHAALAVASVFYCFRVGRLYGWLALPVALGIVLSTVYLRYHFVVDVLAGIALALFGVLVLDRLHRRLEGVLWPPAPRHELAPLVAAKQPAEAPLP